MRIMPSGMAGLFVFHKVKKRSKGTYLAIDTLGDRNHFLISSDAAVAAARTERPILPISLRVDLAAFFAASPAGFGFTSMEVFKSEDWKEIFISRSP